MFGLTFEKLVLVGIIAAVIIGPTRLPRFAQVLAETIRSARRYTDAARQRVENDMGVAPDDWQRLDPRRYDPRRIIREAIDDHPAPEDAEVIHASAPEPEPEPGSTAPPPTAVSSDLARLAEISRARAARAQTVLAEPTIDPAPARESTPAGELV